MAGIEASLLKQLDVARTILIAFAWLPEAGALIYVKRLKVNGSYVVLPQEGRDAESPYTIPLGLFSPGEKLNIAWELRAFNEINHLAAFTNTGPKQKWVLVPDSRKDNFKAVNLWKHKAEVEVA